MVTATSDATGFSSGRGQESRGGRRHTRVDQGQGTAHPSAKRPYVDAAYKFGSSSKAGVEFSTTSAQCTRGFWTSLRDPPSIFRCVEGCSESAESRGREFCCVPCSHSVAPGRLDVPVAIHFPTQRVLGAILIWEASCRLRLQVSLWMSHRQPSHRQPTHVDFQLGCSSWTVST